MKILLSSIIVIVLMLTNQAFSEQKIAFIDMDKILSTSESGSSILKQLTDLNNKNLDFLKKEEKKFKGPTGVKKSTAIPTDDLILLSSLNDEL